MFLLGAVPIGEDFLISIICLSSPFPFVSSFFFAFKKLDGLTPDFFGAVDLHCTRRRSTISVRLYSLHKVEYKNYHIPHVCLQTCVTNPTKSHPVQRWWSRSQKLTAYASNARVDDATKTTRIIFKRTPARQETAESRRVQSSKQLKICLQRGSAGNVRVRFGSLVNGVVDYGKLLVWPEGFILWCRWSKWERFTSQNCKTNALRLGEYGLSCMVLHL